MIVKNGEILAIDHIAHDNTLSGNGTSAKPVGLSQLTKDLIDSKVKKTDFETYKSSAANQISNINTKITTDESNFESYKSSAANQINNINNKIAADEADFNSYKTSAATEIANQVSTLNGKITDVANAKQDKGNYVSASDFNSYKSSAHNEIERIDGKIDTTSANLRDNYYKTTETYNRTEVDEKFANFGGFKFRDPDPTKDNEPKLAPGEVIDPKAIYLTQPAGATQYLQWIWNTEVTPNVWKCIGDTTMDLSDYAKTVDVVASANNNVQTVKDWADAKFETKQDFESVIAGYYTKDEVNTELATKVDNDDFNAYKTEVAGKFTNTSAWANEKFATKQNLTDTKAELEDTIESVSGEIISKVNTDYGILDDEIDAIATTLSNDYYTSQEIDTRLAASGEYYTKTESDTKYAEKSVFETAINELSSNKLDKSATANWDVTEYTEGENIKIVGHEISGKDWSDEIAAAVENKVDESELENYYTSSQIDNKFVTKDKFNELDDEVGFIVNDLDTLSGKTISVIKDSETVKAIRSTEPDGTISYTLSAHDGKQADYLWKPTVNAAGDISWELALTGDTPATANIKGSDGDNGKTPELTSENYHIKWKYTDESIWNDLGDFRGASGADGKDGKDGKDGINGTSAFVRINPTTNYWEISNNNETWTSTDISATGPQGEEGDDGEPGFSPTVAAVAITDGEKTGTEITFTYKDAQGQTQTTVYSAWNGINGEGATVHFDGIDGIKITPVDTTHFNIGLSADYKTQVEAVSGKLDASDLNGYATETWVEGKHYLVADDIAGKADKTELETVSGEIVTMIPSLNGYATEQYVQGASAEVTAWVDEQHYLISVPSEYITETELSTALLGYLTKLSADDLYQPKGNYLTTVATSGSIIGTGLSTNKIGLVTTAENALTDVANKANTADVYSKTDADDKFVTSADITTQETDYVMTTTGWKVLTLPGGGMTQVIHDATLTGQGNDNNSKLGVAWSALSGNTITSALSAGSASYAVALGTTASYSGLSDIVGAINAKADATDISDMLTKTLAASTYQTTAGMSNYLTTTVASQTYLDKTTYATDSATFVTSSTTAITGTKQYALTNTGWAEVSTPTIPDITATNGISADGHNIGLTESVYSAIQEISAANDLVGANGISVVAGANNQIIIAPSGISPSKQYAMTTTGWAEVQAGTTFTGVTTAGSISGDGLTNPLGLTTTAENALTAVSNKLDTTAAAETYQTIAGMNDYLTTTDAATTYLPLTGGTVTGQITLTGTGWGNRLTIGRSNSAIDIGVASNGALTLKANVNNACQFNMMQTGTSGVDINITYGQTPSAIGNLYVMKTHTTAEATTASGSWNGDNLLHIILDS